MWRLSMYNFTHTFSIMPNTHVRYALVALAAIFDEVLLAESRAQRVHFYIVFHQRWRQWRHVQSVCGNLNSYRSEDYTSL